MSQGHSAGGDRAGLEPGICYCAVLIHSQKMPVSRTIVSNADLVTVPVRAGPGTLLKSFLDTGPSISVLSCFQRLEWSSVGGLREERPLSTPNPSHPLPPLWSVLIQEKTDPVKARAGDKYQIEVSPESPEGVGSPLRHQAADTPLNQRVWGGPSEGHLEAQGIQSQALRDGRPPPWGLPWSCFQRLGWTLKSCQF